MSPPNERERRFVRSLEQLRDEENRAALAALRRGLGKSPAETAEMHRYVLPWISPDAPPWEEEPYYLIASLFAWHQISWPEGDSTEPTNLGASFARLAREVEGESVERRFVAMLNCHREDLPAHLRHAVGLLKGREVPIDWAQLLSDVRHWGRESRSVQLEWARAFWGAAPEGEAAQEKPGAAQPGAAIH